MHVPDNDTLGTGAKGGILLFGRLSLGAFAGASQVGTSRGGTHNDRSTGENLLLVLLSATA